ncbi:Flap-structured DNA-binding and RNA-binding protein [Entomophthora muscae]|uniref:Flap-structured DNA-binding and RNA-binding protein n=2 Tax=Entomophthora muscae TaxID=34485 RepID=A0ACC2TT69_9FUNG|nr:Flap-structured DNA-binding and RNA-binding protein [Entomophthora muscae]
MSDHSSIDIPCITATPSSPRYVPSPNRLNSIRPNSEVYNQKPGASPEADALERWFEDLAQYERMLEEMSKASLEPSFKEELGAVENWFSALSQAEKTAALYSLMHQSTNVQIRFFITVLQKMNKDPVRDILSPAFSRQGLQTYSDYPLPNRQKNIDRHSLPTGKAEIPRPSSLEMEHVFNPRMSLKSQSYNPEDTMGFNWKASPGRIPTLDLKGASNWGGWDLSHTTSSERSLSATNVKDSNWGKLRNSNNLTLKVDNVEVPLESSHWLGTATRPKSARSPAFPPGLHTASSPIPWAINTTPLDLASSPKPSLPDELKEPKPLDPVDFEVLESIPAWMRSLRLHKYTSLFEKMTWREVIALDDKQLTEVGVAALGARRKFLKVFEHVKHEAELKGIPTDIKKIIHSTPV